MNMTTDRTLCTTISSSFLLPFLLCMGRIFSALLRCSSSCTTGRTSSSFLDHSTKTSPLLSANFIQTSKLQAIVYKIYTPDRQNIIYQRKYYLHFIIQIVHSGNACNTVSVFAFQHTTQSPSRVNNQWCTSYYVQILVPNG